MYRLVNARMRDDAGAVSTIVAVMFISGVLFGMLSLTFDVGRLYSERRTVQDAADSAAWAGAVKCALSVAPAVCDGVTVDALTASFTNPNSPDQRTDISGLCLHTGATVVCPTPTNAILDCTPTPDTSAMKYVRVYTNSTEPDGSGAIPAIFANVLGGGGVTATAVGACAQAKWGTGASAPVKFPFAVPICGFKLNTWETYREQSAQTGSQWRETCPTDQPPYQAAGAGPCNMSGTTPQAYDEDCKLLPADYLKKPPTGYVPFNIPGVSQADECTLSATIKIGDILSTNGRDDQHVCGQVGDTDVTNFLKNLMTNQTLLVLPVVNCIYDASGACASGTVRVLGFVSFKFTAMYWKGGTYGSYWNGSAWATATSTWFASGTPQCSNGAYADPYGAKWTGSSNCFHGKFMPYVVPGDVDSSRPNLGLQAVKLIP